MILFWLMWLGLVLGGLAGGLYYRGALARRFHLVRVPVTAQASARQRVSPGRDAGLALRQLPVPLARAVPPWPVRRGRQGTPE